MRSAVELRVLALALGLLVCMVPMLEAAMPTETAPAPASREWTPLTIGTAKAEVHHQAGPVPTTAKLFSGFHTALVTLPPPPRPSARDFTEPPLTTIAAFRALLTPYVSSGL